MSNDEDIRWAPWFRRVPERWRTPIAVAIFFGFLILSRVTGLRGWMSTKGVAFPAVLVMLLGMWGLALGFGPERWIQKDRQKTKRAPFPPGVRHLAKAPIPAMRVFFIVFGVAAVSLATYVLVTA